MDKNLKKGILISVIIASLAIVFIPIYFFVLADSSHDKFYEVIDQKIIVMEDGTAEFDADDAAGNDSSAYNNIVRTFDKISYTVSYKLTRKSTHPDAPVNIDGRELIVEVLIPTSYSARLKYSYETDISIYPGASLETVTKDGIDYYYTFFNVPVEALDVDSSFVFSLEDISTDSISTHNSIKPLVYIKESTDDEAASAKNASVTPASAAACNLTSGQSDPSNCTVTLSGKEDYFVNMYAGTNKAVNETTNQIPIGLLIGLRNQENGKGIKGLAVPNQVSFTISNSNTAKLGYVENSVANYDSNTGYEIKINGSLMPSIDNGTVSGSIADNLLTASITGIDSYKLNPMSDFYYFTSKYFVLETNRQNYDYSDINATLTAVERTNSSGAQSSITATDSYNYILGNYISNIEVYERSPQTGSTAEDPLPYGNANINYGADYTLEVNFSYSGRTDSRGDGLTSLTNYVKIDNDALKLFENSSTYKSYDFEDHGADQSYKITPELDQTGHQKVYFGFGEWNSTYFDIAPSAPSGCPSSIGELTREQLMNLYGGPCIVEKSTIQWAYSPVSTDDISGNPITTEKGPMIVKSTYVSENGEYIKASASATLELYGAVIDDYRVADNVYQITTSATAYGKTSTDFKYLGNETSSGEALLTNRNNFTKTSYDFTNRYLATRNSNLCSYDDASKCAVTGTSIVTSGLKTTNPAFSAHKVTDLNTSVENFYYYPIALKVNANAIKSDDDLKVNQSFVDIYLPSYMTILNNYGEDTVALPTTEETTLVDIYNRFGLGTPSADANYRIYHYILNEDSVSNFVVYADIDPVNTPTSIKSELFTVVDFEAIRTINGETPIYLRPITSETERMNSISVNLHNSSTVITKGSSSPKYIEKNGSYTYSMFAYNHSATLVEGGYTYPTADLYYVLPYNLDMSDESLSSKIGNTKYTVNFTEESISGITNRSDYKFYYATTGVPSNIISDEISTASTASSIWNLWEDPTSPVSNVIAIKIVKQSPFAPGEYFASADGLMVNVETVGSSDSNTFYNTFSLLTTKPDDYECDTVDPEETDSDTCEETKNTKDNYSPTPTVTSVYSREITGFVFDDSDYNGIYTSEESKVKDIAVTLYKIDTLPENYDENDPTTYVKDTDKVISSTLTGANGNYYFGGLSTGYYYVRFSFDNDKYNVADFGKTSEYIPDSAGNNSKALLIPGTNKAVTKIVTFNEDYTSGKNIVSGMNMGLNVKKEMAVKLNKFITEVIVTKDGKVTKYDYSDKNLSQVSISVLNTKNTKIQVKYAFSIENTKYFPGYVGLIIDSMPKDMTFNPNLEENKNWAIYDNTLYYNGLSGKLLLPNEKQYFKLTLDLDLKEAGTYRNVITAKDLTIMGNDLPVYNFDELNAQGGE